MKRRKADDRMPKWVWDKDLEWGDPPFDPITPVVVNLLVRFKWWSNKDRRKRERYRKWLQSAQSKSRGEPQSER